MKKGDKFYKGDTVTIKQPVNKPAMVVKDVIKVKFTKEHSPHDDPFLIGVKCFWFTKDYEYRSEIFHSKDLIKI